MARFKPNDLLKELHGKHCMHSDTYYAQRNGTMYTGTMCNPSTKPPTASQTAQRAKFATAIANVKALTTAEKAAYETAFKSYQGKYKTLQGYMFAQELAKL